MRGRIVGIEARTLADHADGALQPLSLVTGAMTLARATGCSYAAAVLHLARTVPPARPTRAMSDRHDANDRRMRLTRDTTTFVAAPADPIGTFVRRCRDIHLTKQQAATQLARKFWWMSMTRAAEEVKNNWHPKGSQGANERSVAAARAAARQMPSWPSGDEDDVAVMYSNGLMLGPTTRLQGSR